LLQEQYTHKQIAYKLGRSPSSIGREIKKGLDGNGAYLPKHSDIRNLTQKELDNIASELNNKPRKRLKWHTPLRSL